MATRAVRRTAAVPKPTNVLIKVARANACEHLRNWPAWKWSRKLTVCTYTYLRAKGMQPVDTGLDKLEARQQLNEKRWKVYSWGASHRTAWG